MKSCIPHSLSQNLLLLLDQDRPLFTEDKRIIFASTHRPAKKPRQGWTAIYSLSGGNTSSGILICKKTSSAASA